MIQLQLADVPLDADVANPEGRPLGSPDVVASRLTELLPGTQFDDAGRGTFSRGGYQMAFKLVGNPATAIGVAFEDAGAFAALKRIVDKTGWCLVDPLAKKLVDVEASRVAGKTVIVGEDSPVVEAAPSPSRPKVTLVSSTRPRMWLVLAAAFVIAAAAGVTFRETLAERLPVRLRGSAVATSRESGKRFEAYSDRVRRRTAAMKTFGAAFRDNRIVEQLVDVQMASRAYWNFMDGRFSTPELLSNASVWSRFQMQPFLPPTFGTPERDGYQFEFSGQSCEEPDPGWPDCTAFVYVARPVNADRDAIIYALFSADDRIHFRKDGLLPTRTDPTVDTP